jgi:hypothetical protein
MKEKTTQTSLAKRGKFWKDANVSVTREGAGRQLGLRSNVMWSCGAPETPFPASFLSVCRYHILLPQNGFFGWRVRMHPSEATCLSFYPQDSSQSCSSKRERLWLASLSHRRLCGLPLHTLALSLRKSLWETEQPNSITPTIVEDTVLQPKVS